MPEVARVDGAPADEVLDGLAEAVAARVRGRRTAEQRLGAFAFHDERPAARPGGTAGMLGPATDVPEPGRAPIDWRYFVVRALAALDDPDAIGVLTALPPGGRTLDELVGLLEPAGRDPVAAADRVARLAAAGLVGRDLESDRVSLLPLGEALLVLIAELARRAGSVDR